MGSFLQTAAWARFQQQFGYPVHEVDGTFYIQRNMPFGPYLLCSRCNLKPDFTLPTGPSRFIRFEPETTDSLLNLQEFARTHDFALKAQHAVQPRQTSLVSIANSNEEILAKMHQKHRYNIKVAAKHGVTVETFSTNLLDGPFERFWNLLESTSKRQEFRLHPREYYRTMVQTLEPEGMVHIHIAKLNNEDLATLLMITYEGVATYLHGGSLTSHQKVMAPYALHWHSILRAKELGCTTYDLWGTDATLNPETNLWEAKKDARSYGTTRFKLGFGGSIVEYPGTFDLVLAPFWYSMYSSIRTLRGSGNRAFS